MIINSSVVIKKNIYKIEADTSLQQPLITISGNNITVDFNKATLQGSENITQPNSFHGLAIFIKPGSSNIILKNVIARGYKIAIMADSVSDLTIVNSDLSYNYRQHLHSNYEREDISDWMSYHHNENNEWLRYGAGIYLKNCSRAIIKNNIVTNGQCGLMMTGCNDNEVHDNNFSFNSGIGIGLYRSSRNKIYHNTLYFNVRGFSFGKYYRGQDSAGFLVFEQCNNNIFAYNNASHSGDGFFLWAGQTTMDTGEGGCNDNLLYENNFSYAPTNGVEVTFSKNNIIKNIIKGCDNGIWGGYSFNTTILENNIDSNKTGIAIEHGQHIDIFKNNLSGNTTAVKLWSREKQPVDWKYAQVRDTRSVEYNIRENIIRHNNLVYDIMGTDSIEVANNANQNNQDTYKLGKRIGHFDSSKNTVTKINSNDYKRMLSAIPVQTIPPAITNEGRNAMRITEWGPYNFEYPVIRLQQVDSNNIYHFELLAKSGNWKLHSVQGFKILSNGNNTFPSYLTAKADAVNQEKNIVLQYTGPAFTDAFGRHQSADEPYTFSYKKFDTASKWDISFFKWGGTYNPEDFESFKTTFDQQPVFDSIVSKIDYTWWSAIERNLPADSFATEATTTMNLPEADYIIGVTADDFAKVLVDDTVVIDAWDSKYVQLDEDTHHEVTMHLKGKHQFKILHAENTGLATLMFYLEKK